MTPALSYRTAFITGASSGIGRALAERLARHGVEVAVAARRSEELDRLVETVVRNGGRARAYPLDVTDTNATRHTLERADDELGGVDLVVANAGVSSHQWAGRLRWEDCAPVIAVNVSGAVATLLALLPRMVERKRGHLVGVSSLAQYRGLPRSGAYSASKAFLSTFLESLRVDLSDTGVRVTDVRPGFVETPMTARDDMQRPFMIDIDTATDAIVSGIARASPVVVFPWQLASLVRGATLLPASVYDRAVRRVRQG